MAFQKCFCVFLLLLCGSTAAQSGATIVDSIYSGGQYRYFRTYVPPVYSGATAVPLLLNFHGYSSNAAQQQVYSNFMAVADTANFIVVHPEGTLLAGTQFWNAGVLASPDDVAFTDQLITYLQQKYTIDFARVYACGMSNGGIMSYYLACRLSHRIAAIASVTGCMLSAWQSSCTPGRAIPVMEIHGTGDNIVPYAGTGDIVPVDSTIRHWVKHNNCLPAPVTFSVADINAQDNSTAVNYRYSGGTNSSAVELYRIEGGSHSWPGAFPIFPATNGDINATVEIWRFFRQYNLRQFVPSAGIGGAAAEPEIKVFPNPASSHVQLRCESEATVVLMATDGRLLPLRRQDDLILLEGLTPGLYLLRVSHNGQERLFRIVKD